VNADDEKLDHVAETQVDPDNVGSDDDASVYSDHSVTPKMAKTESKRAEPAGRGQPKKEDDGSKKNEGDGIVRAAARKVKESAHANYRRLKIKSKTATGSKGRFGRRR